MKLVFEEGDFKGYSQSSLNESRSSIMKHSSYGIRKTTVFISHKHADLEDLKGVLGFLQRIYDVKVYIDSRDPTMPKITSAETARNIKERIKQCDKFILLATNGAIKSEWCNWELGYGDAHKYKKNIALFPIKPKGASDSSYDGFEYMNIYPFVVYYNGTEKYTNGNSIPRGYYVRDESYITPLGEWLKER